LKIRDPPSLKLWRDKAAGKGKAKGWMLNADGALKSFRK
jgi:hypothetical protein